MVHSSIINTNPPARRCPAKFSINRAVHLSSGRFILHTSRDASAGLSIVEINPPFIIARLCLSAADARSILREIFVPD